MTPKKIDAERRGRGRPQSFDRTQALYAAVRLFWDRGYDGTSFDDLIAAMGISPSSFYNAFKSKEALFQEAVEAYAQASGAWFDTVLKEHADTRTALERLLAFAATEFTRIDRPTGCMIAVAATQCSPSQERLRELVATQRTQSESAMANRLRQGVASGDLPASTDIEALAAFYMSLIRGMAVQARDGAARERLLEIARIGMQAWPAKDGGSNAA
ncbi:transcriptional regulator [Acetobacter nitrogenifigens DSM 23921 = NBRC 105050]|uniref:TetR family transcriptional regulator n=1 Tax=Acetobacter nitrogenifigens DSM 23921 = NBRC 105050 TaxID=1120919 RepID=A0A511X781_9PROT|nr:TetR/AcrR family transcriptional regulator [Acetobacter nitrogenifigens]GBQ95365.1 transcriptional regulator [Acetobacter nitrogenifigens DSM 23921 = NBRC 105050]GEN58799.1 TetR family transcriptional regulator [Acetobacter nitrogenifigens DSM 23921 = NBRC 105050]